jgi:hypothetical protein
MPGAYTKKIFFGQFFPEKTRDDFEGANGDAAYEAYLKSIEKNEWVVMREADMTETVSLMQNDRLSDDDKKIIAMASPDKAVELLKAENKSGMESLNNNRKAIEKCILNSSVTNGEEWAGPVKTMDVFMSKIGLFNFIVEQWQEIASGFQKKKKGK